MTEVNNFKLKSWKVFSNCSYLLKAHVVPAKQVVGLYPVASLLNMMAC